MQTQYLLTLFIKGSLPRAPQLNHTRPKLEMPLIESQNA